MQFKNIHFMCHGTREPAYTFTQHLMKELGQSSMAEADVIVSIGGDGLFLQALRQSEGTPVYGLTPAGSNSRGFWTDHDVDSAQKLTDNLIKAEMITLHPLKADIRFAGGNSIVRHAFNDFAIGSVAGQAAIINLTAHFSGVATQPERLIGDGLVFSTAQGSTGTNMSYDGPVVDIRNHVIVMTGKGISQPRRMGTMVAAGATTVFTADLVSSDAKRPVRVDYDGLSVDRDAEGNAIVSVKISMETVKTAKMLVTSEPALRAFQAIMR